MVFAASAAPLSAFTPGAGLPDEKMAGLIVEFKYYRWTEMDGDPSGDPVDADG